MEVFLLLLILIAIVAGIYMWWSKRAVDQEAAARRERAARRPVDPLADWSASGGDEQFRKLKPGDLVKSDDGDHLIRGSMTFEEGGSIWYEHLLDDSAGNKQWLAVEDDEGLELGLWQRIPMADVEGEPGARSVVVRGVAYKLIERGTARYTGSGSTGTPGTGSAEYIDYEAADKSMLGFEKYDGGPWEAALGRVAVPSQFEVYPAGQVG